MAKIMEKITQRYEIYFTTGKPAKIAIQPIP